MFPLIDTEPYSRRGYPIHFEEDPLLPILDDLRSIEPSLCNYITCKVEGLSSFTRLIFAASKIFAWMRTRKPLEPSVIEICNYLCRELIKRREQITHWPSFIYAISDLLANPQYPVTTELRATLFTIARQKNFTAAHHIVAIATANPLAFDFDTNHYIVAQVIHRLAISLDGETNEVKGSLHSLLIYADTFDKQSLREYFLLELEKASPDKRFIAFFYGFCLSLDNTFMNATALWDAWGRCIGRVMNNLAQLKEVFDINLINENAVRIYRVGEPKQSPRTGALLKPLSEFKPTEENNNELIHYLVKLMEVLLGGVKTTPDPILKIIKGFSWKNNDSGSAVDCILFHSREWDVVSLPQDFIEVWPKCFASRPGLVWIRLLKMAHDDHFDRLCLLAEPVIIHALSHRDQGTSLNETTWLKTLWLMRPELFQSPAIARIIKENKYFRKDFFLPMLAAILPQDEFKQEAMRLLTCFKRVDPLWISHYIRSLTDPFVTVDMSHLPAQTREEINTLARTATPKEIRRRLTQDLELLPLRSKKRIIRHSDEELTTRINDWIFDESHESSSFIMDVALLALSPGFTIDVDQFDPFTEWNWSEDFKSTFIKPLPLMLCCELLFRDPKVRQNPKAIDAIEYLISLNEWMILVPLGRMAAKGHLPPLSPSISLTNLINAIKIQPGVLNYTTELIEALASLAKAGWLREWPKDKKVLIDVNKQRPFSSDQRARLITALYDLRRHLFPVPAWVRQPLYNYYLLKAREIGGPGP